MWKIRPTRWSKAAQLAIMKPWKSPIIPTSFRMERFCTSTGGKSIRPMMADSFMTEETHTARPYFITTTNSANKLKLQNENLNKAIGFQNPLSQKFYLLADFTQLKTII